MNESHPDKLTGKLSPEMEVFFAQLQNLVQELMKQEESRPRRDPRPLPTPDETAKWEEQRREDRRREKRIKQELHELWETLAGSAASLNQRTCRLLDACVAEGPHPLFETLRGLDYDGALDDLLAWEQKFAGSSFSSDVLRFDLLSFETYECGDDAAFGLHCYGAIGEDYGYGRSWPKLLIRVLEDTASAISVYCDTKEIPHAVEIADCQWRPAFICLLLSEFLQQSKFLVPACQNRVEVRMLLGNVVWYPVGNIIAGEFVANSNPLANEFYAG